MSAQHARLLKTIEMQLTHSCSPNSLQITNCIPVRSSLLPDLESSTSLLQNALENSSAHLDQLPSTSPASLNLNSRVLIPYSTPDSVTSSAITPATLIHSTSPIDIPVTRLPHSPSSPNEDWIHVPPLDTNVDFFKLLGSSSTNISKLASSIASLFNIASTPFYLTKDFKLAKISYTRILASNYSSVISLTSDDDATHTYSLNHDDFTMRLLNNTSCCDSIPSSPDSDIQVLPSDVSPDAVFACTPSLFFVPTSTNIFLPYEDRLVMYTVEYSNKKMIRSLSHAVLPVSCSLPDPLSEMNDQLPCYLELVPSSPINIGNTFGVKCQMFGPVIPIIGGLSSMELSTYFFNNMRCNCFAHGTKKVYVNIRLHGSENFFFAKDSRGNHCNYDKSFLIKCLLRAFEWFDFTYVVYILDNSCSNTIDSVPASSRLAIIQQLRTVSCRRGDDFCEHNKPGSHWIVNFADRNGGCFEYGLGNIKRSVPMSLLALCHQERDVCYGCTVNANDFLLAYVFNIPIRVVEAPNDLPCIVDMFYFSCPHRFLCVERNRDYNLYHREHQISTTHNNIHKYDVSGDVIHLHSRKYLLN